VSLFSGIGAYENGLSNLHIDYELIKYCELNEIKAKAYSILHNVSEERNLVDVTNINTSEIEDFDLLVYSPPCQAFSVAGKKQGLNDIRGTLFYNALQVIQNKKPKYCIMENVDNLPNGFNDEFNDMLNHLDQAGYNNYWKIINAKDFLPQNRLRVFVVSIRKDIDKGDFEFPIGTYNGDWSNYIDISKTRALTGRQQRMVDFVLGKNQDDNIKIEGKPQFNHATIMLRQSGLRFQDNHYLPTLCAAMGKGGGNFPMIAYNNQIGGLTPRQCFKLMGFDYSDCEKLEQAGFSNSNLYLMAGDSVVVTVLEGIYKSLLKDYIK
jgi:DNA (cytosine-5)-methyltransferase 1